MRGLGRVKLAVGKVKRFFIPSAAILSYHRIVDTPIDPRGTAVSPENFSQQLDYIKHKCHPMHLLDLVEALQSRSVPDRAIAITIDDGHCSTFEKAYPLLTAGQIPATIFITTGKINDPHEFWWDELEHVLLHTKIVPVSLYLQIGGQEFHFSTGTWEERLKAYHTIRILVRRIDDDERQILLSYLYRWIGQERITFVDSRPLGSHELSILAQDHLITIGAHTVTHPVLARLPLDQQRDEILASRSFLESFTDQPVLTFAYPFGQVEDFSVETMRIVQELGFRLACTTLHGLVKRGSDLFCLNRIAVMNTNGVTFRKNFEWLFYT